VSFARVIAPLYDAGPRACNAPPSALGEAHVPLVAVGVVSDEGDATMMRVGQRTKRALACANQWSDVHGIASRLLAGAVSVVTFIGPTLAPVPAGAAEPPPRTGSDPAHTRPEGHDAMHQHQGNDAGHEHQHVAPPPAYARRHAPMAAWTDAGTIARGKGVYETRCVVCHGERGDGKGPGAAGLTLKAPDLTDATMVAHMTDSYWFWRVSEGGTVEPLKSQGSAMPAWKSQLSVPERWAVIAYQHTFSGHRGPHGPAEHPEMTKRHEHPREATPGRGHTGPPATPEHGHQH
jgi:mono/diheme cytochrome c family protein